MRRGFTQRSKKPNERRRGSAPKGVRRGEPTRLSVGHSMTNCHRHGTGLLSLREDLRHHALESWEFPNVRLLAGKRVGTFTCVSAGMKAAWSMHDAWEWSVDGCTRSSRCCVKSLLCPDLTPMTRLRWIAQP